MIKKFFKWTFIIFGSLIALAAISYGVFHLWEYATGGKYVEYLKENSETIPIEDSFTYEELGKDVAKNKVILVGEIHGFNEPCKFDVDFFKFLNNNFEVNHYFAELDYVQALYMNEYLISGDEALLADVLLNWAVFQGRNNKDYFDKYRALHKLYQQLPENNRFEFVGIDKTQDVQLTSQFINNLDSAENKIKATLSADSVLMKIESLRSLYVNSDDTLFMLNHIKSNLEWLANKENRENVLFNNFHSLYKYKQLEKSRVYGFFGLAHIFQYRINGSDPLAAKIRKSDLGLEGQILSVNFFLNDSYAVMPSNMLPEFMRSEGKYSRMPISADNMLFIYVYGIKDFKRMTPEHHKSLIKMNADDSPYSDSKRMNINFQILPVTDLMEFNDVGKPYVQYTVFVRNSDWAEPIE